MANRIILGATSQVLRHVPTGPVTDASFVFEDVDASRPIGHADRVIASGSIVPPSWSLTSNATAGPTQRNGKRISVSSTTGASIGAKAVIVGPDGTREQIEIAALSANSYIEAASVLAGVYASGSTVYGVELTASVPDDFAADEDRFKLDHPLRVTWTYTLDGVTRPYVEIVEWVRSAAAIDTHVGEAVVWLTKAYPDLTERGGPDNTQIKLIAPLMAEEVANDLRARSIDPTTFLVGDRARALLVARILAHMGELGYAPLGFKDDQAAWAARAWALYEKRFDDLTIGVAGHATAATDTRTDTAPETPDQAYRHVFRQM